MCSSQNLITSFPEFWDEVYYYYYLCLTDATRQQQRRIFTAKEIKAITKKNYEKLPEVRQKIVNSKEKQIRFANRLVADTFNKVRTL